MDNPFANMSPAEEASYREYLESQSDPALIVFELRSDAGRPAYVPEAFDEMERQDREGRS
jgi:hypothetical protein